MEQSFVPNVEAKQVFMMNVTKKDIASQYRKILFFAQNVGSVLRLENILYVQA